ncbi:hypothetical protein EDD15DRAFT_2202795 [Pisolithus albus]|nr:hypothetical protein EDD15DRAFT_2202795 [Pisolithus albus]
MSHPPQRRVRFYMQVDVLPIENRDESGASSGAIPSSSPHTRATVRENKSMEALQAYGEDSPSPPSEPVTVGDQYARLPGDKVPSPPVEPNQEPQADLFEQMKVAEVPEPPTSHDMQADVEAEPYCDPSERMTPALIRRSPTPAEHEDVSEWPAEWFSNISSDLRELDHLVLISVCRRSPFPPLPACYHAYLRWKDVEDEFQNELRRIPKESFQLLDNLGSFIPNWTPRFPDKYGGFAFPWWLHGASRYSVDFEELRGAKVFQTAAEYFQHEWPLNEPSFSDRLDSLLEDRVAQYMTSLVYISNIIERIDGEMNHLFSWWFALQKLVGTPNVS